MTLCCLGVWSGCVDRDEPPETEVAAPAHTATVLDDALEEVSAELGIAFTHSAGSTAGFPMPQIMGSGGAFLDADADGRLDLLLLDGVPPSGEPGCRLYCQQPDGSFHDVTPDSGLDCSGFGMGVAVGDVDNDGLVDVYVSSSGSDRLFHNLGNRQFTDVSVPAGIRNDRWGTAAVFFDYDRDGWLDLFVANYLDYFPGSVCTDATGRRDYCGPQSFSGTSDKLFRNLGTTGSSTHANFEDVSLTVGLAGARHKGLGAVCRDFNGDRLPDIFVANDQEANCLWIQQPDGTFVDEAALRGVAFNALGRAEANMGVACDDLNGDAGFDLFVTHLRGETNTLFIGDEEGRFMDHTSQSGLGPPGLTKTGFGTVAADLDDDGDLDLLVVNGRVKRDPFRTVYSTTETADWRDYAESNQIFINDGQGRFEEDARGERFTQPVEISRGLAAGDIDADGDQDFLVTNTGGRCRVYRNNYPKVGQWLVARAFDPALHRDAIGATILVTAGGRTVARELLPASSYLSSHDAEVYFGLGDVDQVDALEVIWPSGTPVREAFSVSGVNRRVTLRHSEGLDRDAAVGHED